METFRLTLTVIWCAILAGLNGYVLAAIWWPGLRAGVAIDLAGYVSLTGAVLTLAIAIGAMLRPHLLWLLAGMTVVWLVVGVGVSLGSGEFQPRRLLGFLFILVPTYLLARWHSVAARAQARANNLAEEF